MSSVLKKGSSGEHVQQLQEHLTQLGFSLDVDGDFGDATHHAVIALQTIFGYDIDGMVGPATQKLIHKRQSFRTQIQALHALGEYAECLKGYSPMG
jgi:peptidoglycan hydrolase-like protein with peptidoglycan-binding domain